MKAQHTADEWQKKKLISQKSHNIQRANPTKLEITRNNSGSPFPTFTVAFDIFDLIESVFFIILQVQIHVTKYEYKFNLIIFKLKNYILS